MSRNSQTQVLILLLCATFGLLITAKYKLLSNNGPDGAGLNCDDILSPSRPGTAGSDTQTIQGTKRHDESSSSLSSAMTPKSATRFVFTMGLEKTGHEIMKDIVERSPTLHQIKEFWPDVHAMIPTLAASVVKNPESEQGLLSAHCNAHQKEGGVNATQLFEKVVDNLKRMDAAVKKHMDNGENGVLPKNQPVTIPVNAAQVPEYYSGMVSYPYNQGSCRSLNYPNLDVFYDACQEANVECDHVYLYRDPYEIVAATTAQGFNNHALGAVQLYIMHLSIIYTHFSFHPTKTLACMGLFEDNFNNWDAVRDLYGWNGKQQQFDAVINEVYKPEKVKTLAERKALVPSEFHVSMESMMVHHKRVVALCHQQESINNRNGVLGYN